MNRTALLLFLILIPHKIFPQSEDIRSIYSLIIESYCSDRNDKILINALTSTYDDVKNLDTKYFRRLFKEIKDETCKSFIENNQISDTLVNDFLVSKEVILKTTIEVMNFFKEDGGGWTKFYEKYGTTQGILTMSKIGFNEEHTEALIYFGNQSDWLAGAGYYGLLVKKQGEWILVEKIMKWIS